MRVATRSERFGERLFNGTRPRDATGDRFSEASVTMIAAGKLIASCTRRRKAAGRCALGAGGGHAPAAGATSAGDSGRCDKSRRALNERDLCSEPRVQPHR
jgi:hypothetical protein